MSSVVPWGRRPRWVRHLLRTSRAENRSVASRRRDASEVLRLAPVPHPLGGSRKRRTWSRWRRCSGRREPRGRRAWLGQHRDLHRQEERARSCKTDSEVCRTSKWWWVCRWGRGRWRPEPCNSMSRSAALRSLAIAADQKESLVDLQERASWALLLVWVRWDLLVSGQVLARCRHLRKIRVMDVVWAASEPIDSADLLQMAAVFFFFVLPRREFRSSFSLGSESNGRLGLRRAWPERRTPLPPSSHRLPLKEELWLAWLLLTLLAFDELLNGRNITSSWTNSILTTESAAAAAIRLLWLQKF